MKLSISLPEELVNRIDETAKETLNTRSSFIANACREYIAGLEAKRILPALELAIRGAAEGKQLTDDQRAQLDAFSLLVDQFTR